MTNTNAGILNMGVLGTGRIGRLHSENLSWSIEGARLHTVFDLNQAAAQATAEACGGIKVAESVEELLVDPSLDGVLICTSTDTHADLIERAAKAGKHVFCEKPIAADLGRIDQALEAARQGGIKLQIGFNRRFDPSFRQVHDRVRSGAIGKPHLLRITSRDPEPPPMEYIRISGGLFFDMMIHDFDMARFLVGSEVVSVHAVGATLVDPRIGEAGDIDTAIVTLTFSDGTLGAIDNSRRAVYGYDQRVEVFGDGGMAWADNIPPERAGLADAQGLHTARPLAFFIERYREAYIQEVQAFVDCIRQDTPPPVSGMDGRVPVVMAMAAQRSLQEGRPVLLAEVDQL